MHESKIVTDFGLLSDVGHTNHCHIKTAIMEKIVVLGGGESGCGSGCLSTTKRILMAF